MIDLDKIMSLLNSALFGGQYSSNGDNDNEALVELDKQALLPLMQPVLKSINVTNEQYDLWKRRIAQYIFSNLKIMQMEQAVVDLYNKNNAACIILKGSSFAQYYTNPCLRVRGDIDILVKENDFELASELLIKDGFICDPIQKEEPDWRHIEFFKDKVEIELHRYFLQIDRQSEFLNVDKIDYANNKIPCFPAVENGISMLLHIKYHFGRIGLRHYIDWIMYVTNVCNDEFWNSKFKCCADKFGLTEFAKALTKSGKKYFPISNITWCDDVEDGLCEYLLQTMFNSGNFNANLSRKKAVKLINSDKSFLYWVKIIAERGVDNWKPAQNHKILIPIAFIKQINQYTKWYVKENGIDFLKLKHDSKRIKSIKDIV